MQADQQPHGTLAHPGLTDQEFLRLVELDDKEVEGTMSRGERNEANALLRKLARASRREAWGALLTRIRRTLRKYIP